MEQLKILKGSFKEVLGSGDGSGYGSGYGTSNKINNGLEEK